jgi:GDP-L-fucose synthase
MKTDSRIYIAGHTGLAGSAIFRKLKAEGYTNIITRSHSELDLTRGPDVEKFFGKERPEYVFLAAAKVGGIWANKSSPVDFLLINLKIQNNVIEAAWKHEVKGLIFLGSSCIYPKLAPQPLKEEYLLTGPLEPTNEPYAIGKIAGIELCEASNRQYGTRFLSVMPTNMYGPNDNYDLDSSHVLPALIRKFHLAKIASEGDWETIERDQACYGPTPDEIRARLVAISCSHGHEDKVPTAYRSLFTDYQVRPAVALWGTGKPRREFLYSDDLADACIFLMNLEEEVFRSLLSVNRLPLINIGCGQDQAVRELAALVAKVVGFDGEVEWDTTKPDGTPQKLLDVSRLTELGWKHRISLEEGIFLAYQDYLNRSHKNKE